ncbi:hypothetical protein [Nonomuraea fuscirosea]|uniref:hypothetical protein n=1 Tax=Nonomuraea fuscirosea TaxID=1291556 RepID=UPI0033CF923F
MKVPVGERISKAGHWFGRRLVARPVATLTIIGVIAAAGYFLFGVAVSLATGEQPIPWWRYSRDSGMHLLVWVGVGLLVRSRLKKGD